MSLANTLLRLMPIVPIYMPGNVWRRGFSPWSDNRPSTNATKILPRFHLSITPSCKAETNWRKAIHSAGTNCISWLKNVRRIGKGETNPEDGGMKRNPGSKTNILLLHATWQVGKCLATSSCITPITTRLVEALIEIASAHSRCRDP